MAALALSTTKDECAFFASMSAVVDPGCYYLCCCCCLLTFSTAAAHFWHTWAVKPFLHKLLIHDATPVTVDSTKPRLPSLSYKADLINELRSCHSCCQLLLPLSQLLGLSP
jgi:hypothetical protein